MNIIINNKKIAIRIYTNFFNKLKGLMFKKSINEGIVLKNTNGIHTFFMLNKIDVILTDKDNKILYLYKSIKPGRIILPKKNVYCTYELPINSIDTLKVNDILIVKN